MRAYVRPLIPHMSCTAMDFKVALHTVLVQLTYGTLERQIKARQASIS